MLKHLELGRPKGWSCIIWGCIYSERYQSEPEILTSTGTAGRSPIIASPKMVSSPSPQSCQIGKAEEVLCITSQHRHFLKLKVPHKRFLSPPITRYRRLWVFSFHHGSPHASAKLREPQKESLASLVLRYGNWGLGPLQWVGSLMLHEGHGFKPSIIVWTRRLWIQLKQCTCQLSIRI